MWRGEEGEREGGEENVWDREGGERGVEGKEEEKGRGKDGKRGEEREGKQRKCGRGRERRRRSEKKTEKKYKFLLFSLGFITKDEYEITGKETKKT